MLKMQKSCVRAMRQAAVQGLQNMRDLGHRLCARASSVASANAFASTIASASHEQTGQKPGQCPGAPGRKFL
jgi:hypothetical protein